MEDNGISNNFSELIVQIQNLKSSITTLQKEVKQLEKKSNKKIKNLKHQLEKKKRVKKPSGFAKPTKISNELCEFLEKPFGSEVARTEVTQYLISYIKENELQNNVNKQCITPDEKLQLLLDVSKDEKVTFFNIQGHMNKHFFKN
jgi:chromatin remodeling complex protein RSC6